MLRIYDCLIIDHNLVLVAVAAAIGALGVGATMMATSRSIAADRNMAWAVLAGVCATTTIWSTHFVAMLAYLEQVDVSYDIGHTFASFMAGAIPITIGFVATIRNRPMKRIVFAAGALVGAGVVALHYIGMAAAQFDGRQLTYDLDLVIASVSFSIAFSIASLHFGIARQSRWSVYLGGFFLLLTTIALHFTAMGATAVVLDPYISQMAPGISRATLATIVTLATLAILAVAIVISFVDRRMASQMAADAARFQTLADGAFEGVVIHRNDEILDSNPAFKAMFGARAENQSARLSDFINPGALAAATESLGTPIETKLMRGEGEAFQAEISGRTLQLRDGSTGGLLAIRDINGRKRAEAKLNHLALHDPLTDLPNRRLFIELANKEIAHARRHGRQFSVHVLDLDGFKLINDMHGHESGDALLTEISRRLGRCLRDEDVVARFGGDEFAIIEMGTRQPTDAAVVAERVLEAIRQPVTLPDAEAVISGSIGVAVYPDDGDTIETLLRNADTAMYRAKADGKGVLRFFEAAMDLALVTRRKLENRLRRAIAEEQLEVFYQPLVASVTQEPLGFEALLRWHDEDLGHVSPGEFIPVAEETGLIIALGDFVLRRATAEAATWPGNLRVAVNLSAVQFKRPGLFETVKNALATAGLPGSRLDLEITESILIDNRELVLTTLRQLKELGIRISMDDFGTGYSSLSYLQSFPFDKIKIDRVFVADLKTSRSNSSIIQAVVAMGQSLSMKVVAEGVETAEQAELLGVLHCDELQGFHVARPMAAADVPAFLTSKAAKQMRSVA